MLFFLVNEQIYLKGKSLAFLGLLTTCLRKTILKRKRSTRYSKSVYLALGTDMLPQGYTELCHHYLQ